MSKGPGTLRSHGLHNTKKYLHGVYWVRGKPWTMPHGGPARKLRCGQEIACLGHGRDLYRTVERSGTKSGYNGSLEGLAWQARCSVTLLCAQWAVSKGF